MTAFELKNLNDVALADGKQSLMICTTKMLMRDKDGDDDERYDCKIQSVIT